MSDEKVGYDDKGDGVGDAKSVKVRRQRPSEMNMAEGKDDNEPAPAQTKQRRPRGGDDGGLRDFDGLKHINCTGMGRLCRHTLMQAYAFRDLFAYSKHGVQ